MSTRLYKINGEYNTFEYWHDHYGYTRRPTFSIQYKTTNPWGAAFASGGYYDAEDLMDIFTFSFFVPGVVGWNGIDDLALVGYYPASATDLTVARDSEVSNAATLTQDNETYYLVQNDIEYGWMSQAEFEARGWSTDVGDPPSYIVFDTSTGTIVHSIVDEGMVYGDVGHVLMDEAGSMITVYETGVRTESFYFTTNGRNETQNTNISHADIPVYLEDGTAPAADTPYDGSPVLAFMDVDGNTKQADGESLYVDNGVLRLDAPDTDEGEQWAALVEYIEPSPTLPTVSTSGDFDNNNWLYANTQGADVTVVSGNSTLVGLSGGFTPTAVNYDATKAYAVINWGSYQLASGSGRAEFSIVDSSGKIYAQNNSSGSLKLYALRCAVCSDSTATVITVYSSTDGTAYNSFKYTAGGTDYYYVLDEIQTDWTDDLSDVGYSLEPPAPSFDSATGTISGLTLPTAHSGSYTNVTFDTLRYYVKGTISNNGYQLGTTYYGYTHDWYYGTITWEDASLGDLTDKIAVNPPTRTASLVQQTYFRIIFITSGLSGYHPYDTGDSSISYNQITAYSYNNGVHSITFYCSVNSWYNQTHSGRIQFRYLDGTTTFNGLDAYDLILVNNGVLSKATTTDRYDMYNTYNGDITIHAEY